MDNHIPEPRIEPPEPLHATTSGCKHEVYETDEDERGRPTNFLIDWFDGKKMTTICFDCLLEKWYALSPEEKVKLFGCGCSKVGQYGN